jgi:cytochrome c-type biogenesis protein CcmH/NrfG
MAEIKTTSSSYWTRTHAFLLASACWLSGISVGSLVRYSLRPGATVQGVSPSVSTSLPAQPALPTLNPVWALPPPQLLKEAADGQAAPLLAQLKASPADPTVLVGLGNIYYDAKQYPTAIEYYERALKVQPSNTSVRTDLGTAYWYTGNANTAIEQLNKALSFEPNMPNALFNLGVVEWQGKKEVKAALATWQKLLDTNPNYEGRDKVLQIMAQARQSAAQNP